MVDFVDRKWAETANKEISVRVYHKWIKFAKRFDFKWRKNTALL